MATGGNAAKGEFCSCYLVCLNVCKKRPILEGEAIADCDGKVSG